MGERPAGWVGDKLRTQLPPGRLFIPQVRETQSVVHRCLTPEEVPVRRPETRGVQHWEFYSHARSQDPLPAIRPQTTFQQHLQKAACGTSVNIENGSFAAWFLAAMGSWQ